MFIRIWNRRDCRVAPHKVTNNLCQLATFSSDGCDWSLINLTVRQKNKEILVVELPSDKMCCQVMDTGTKGKGDDVDISCKDAAKSWVVLMTVEYDELTRSIVSHDECHHRKTLWHNMRLAPLLPDDTGIQHPERGSSNASSCPRDIRQKPFDG